MRIRRLRIKKYAGEQELVSVFWAWCGSTSCMDVLKFIKDQRTVHLIHQEPDLTTYRLLFPHVLLVIISISLYQFMRNSGSSGVGDCGQTPNCSNYAIGCFLRFKFFEAFKKSKSRIVNCSGRTNVSFSGNFTEDFRK
jgi:putative component of membrane protein insertase Oxa1/YidC/SpoIIIJ protein YidD